jgi:hypothetical protein
LPRSWPFPSPWTSWRARPAAETRRDVETDHVDAFDDVGKRTFAVLANLGAEGVQTLGPRVGVELDFGLGDAAALSLRGDWLPPASAPGATDGPGGCAIAANAPLGLQPVADAAVGWAF